MLAALIAGCEMEQQTRHPPPVAPASGFVIPKVPRATVEVLNGCGVPGAAQLVANRLRELGFDVVYTGNAPDRPFRRTVVAARTADVRGAHEVAQALGIPRSVFPFQRDELQIDATVFVGPDLATRGARP